MMDAIRKYLISLCAAALLCALVRALVPGGRMKKLCSLLCGIFLMTAALSGISGWQLSDFAQELSKMQVAAEQARTGVEIRNRRCIDFETDHGRRGICPDDRIRQRRN